MPGNIASLRLKHIKHEDFSKAAYETLRKDHEDLQRSHKNLLNISTRKGGRISELERQVERLSAPNNATPTMTRPPKQQKRPRGASIDNYDSMATKHVKLTEERDLLPMESVTAEERLQTTHQSESSSFSESHV